jgi:hypothetical protein
MPIVLRPRDQARLASGLDTMAGIWLLISSVAFTGHEVLSWNQALVGSVIALLAASRAFGGYRSSWPSWVNAVLGLWTMISPWVLVRTMSAATAWNAAITGLIVIVLAVWSALATDLEQESS